MSDDLRALIERSCLPEGFTPTPVEGLELFRMAESGEVQPEPLLDRPVLCVVVAGSKVATMGRRTIRFEPHTCTVTSIDLPVTGVRVDATEAEPFLGMRLLLDPLVVRELLLDLPVPENGERADWAVLSSALRRDVADPLRRLLATMDDPQDVAVLAPSIVREIAYRLLRGPQRPLLTQIADPAGRLARVGDAIARIRERYAEPLRVEDLAKVALMSVSSFHEHFKAVTAVSPLQYQKQLRLREARRLILEGTADATTAGHRVGYRSASQFTREYKRMFGAPPMRDTRRLGHVS
ncbi:AraC family transcriptional regulator N-terminal domain-containing protein [Lentzea sp. NPDC058450]|uniref:AraC family transcriptional regulator n=1 Tax=Lentzea sp. NPDC058450 TaxID=3346505 RepID=UPI003668BF4B